MTYEQNPPREPALLTTERGELEQAVQTACGIREYTSQLQE